MTKQAPPKTDLVIIGGGAAGFFAALHAKATQPSLSVTIIEAAPQPLGKVRISGGGRCNVTTSTLEPDWLLEAYPRSHKAMLGWFYEFGPQQTIDWFEQRGIALKTEADGRIFPTTDSSETIITCLLKETSRLGIRLITKQPVSQIHYQSASTNPFTLLDKAAQPLLHSKALILSTGSSRTGYALAQQLKQPLTPLATSLFTFNVKDAKLTTLQGLSLPWVQGTLCFSDTKITITQEGQLLITHWGLSGPCILRLSAWAALPLQQAHYTAQLRLNLLPGEPSASLSSKLEDQRQQTPKKQVKTVSPWPTQLPKRFWAYLVDKTLGDKASQIPWEALTPYQLDSLINAFQSFSLNIQGKGPFKEEFVTAGGIDLKHLDLNTLESKQTPKLYFAGELLNIDGLTGGYNLQHAWTSGYIAGTSAAKQLTSEGPAFAAISQKAGQRAE